MLLNKINTAKNNKKSKYVGTKKNRKIITKTKKM